MNFNNGINFGKANYKKLRVDKYNLARFKVLHSLKSILNHTSYNYPKIRILQIKKLMKDLIFIAQICILKGH